MEKRGHGGGHTAEYASYLVRLWRFHRGDDEVWRLSATRTDGGEEVTLGGFDELADYLRVDLAARRRAMDGD